MKTALTIAGSDSSGGAGIQADIKTMTANGVFALSAITALTAQNTTGVTGIFETTPEFLAQQLDAVFTDIYPDAVKIGMVSSSALIETIAEKLRQYDAKHIVVDPVMVATSGSKLLQDSAIQILTGQLLPMAEVVTPNIPEAEILSGMTITDEPGIYEEGKLGVRIENELLCVPVCETEYGAFYGFEPFTYCPIDTRPLKLELMTREELEWLDRYHAAVLRELGAYLNKEEGAWLEKACAPVAR